jgi:hypothetical protein
MRIASLPLILLPACDLFSPDDGAKYREACDTTEACAEGLVCGGNATCLLPGEPGTGALEAACEANVSCQLGLVCDGAHTCANDGEPGTAGRGDTCAVESDCQAALGCTSAGTCGGVEPTLWTGAACEDPRADTGRFRGYFQVPRGGAPLPDFYRLPFPNDARVREGGLDLSDHPSPGALVPEIGDVVGAVLRSWEEDFSGFGPNQAIYFRFSDEIDFSTLDIAVPSQPGTVSLVDITPSSPSFGLPQGMSWLGRDDAGLYLCDNAIALSTPAGRPLLGGHTYAAWISTGLRSESGDFAAQDEDFAAMLASERPSDPDLAAAWDAYAPFRSYLDVQGLAAGNVATAAVFTVADTRAPVRALRTQARADAPSALADLHRCDGPGGPWADGADRGCPSAADDAFIELQGRIDLPHYQNGRAPYKDADDGGAISWSGGRPELVDHRDVAFTLTIPRDTPMPPDGWPIVLYGHGSGGSYRSAVAEGIAGWVASIPVDGGTAAYATLTIDAPQHGPRAAPEAWEQRWLDLDADAYAPDVLFYNPLNPRAARDNVLQSAADWFAIAATLDGLVIAADTSPTGEEIRFDPSQRWYLGHSQGASVGPVFASHEPTLTGAVFSAGGGLLIESLLGKTRPHDLPTGVRLALLDPAIDRHHPLLNIIQGFSEVADGVNHASALHYAPMDGDPPRNVVQISGVGDLFTPDATQYALARALVTDQIAGTAAPFANVPVIEPPVSGNGNGVLAVTIRADAPPGGDPHYVLFERADTRAQLLQVLGTSAASGVPEISTP